MLAIISSLCSWVFLFLYHLGNRGGGGTTIEQAPTTPAPSAGESAKDIYEARLEYDPKIAELEMGLQQQYMPQQAALYQSMYNQYMPQMARQQQATQRELYPYQSQIVEQGAQSALSRLANPNYMTPQEQAAQEALRTQAVTGLQKAMRERSNLGGTLYGGRSQAAEARDVTSMLQGFEQEDYLRRMQAGQAAQQALTPYMQILYPQVGTQQPAVGAYQYQSAVPSADALYNAMFQASQPQNFAVPGGGGVSLGILGQWGGY